MAPGPASQAPCSEAAEKAAEQPRGVVVTGTPVRGRRELVVVAVVAAMVVAVTVATVVVVMMMVVATVITTAVVTGIGDTDCAGDTCGGQSGHSGHATGTRLHDHTLRALTGLNGGRRCPT